MDFVEVLKTFGFPVLCVVAMAWAASKIGIWFARFIATPLVDSHIKLTTKITEDMADQTNIMKAHQETLGKMNERLDRHEGYLEVLVKGCPLLERKHETGKA